MEAELREDPVRLKVDDAHPAIGKACGDLVSILIPTHLKNITIAVIRPYKASIFC